MANKWSIITVTYNSADEIRRSWSSQRPRDVEWIVVDNASSDDSVLAARQATADRIIELPSNLGFSAANNKGIAEASGDYILFANPDLRVDFRDLATLQRAIDSGGGLVAPQLLNEDGSLQPNGRGFPTLWNKVANRLSRGEHESYRLYAQPGETRSVCFAIGAAVAGSKDEIVRLGGWDDGFFVYYEDSDLCLRAWLNGSAVRVIGSVRWVHSWNRETVGLKLRPWLLEVQSMVRFYRKYPKLLARLTLAEKTYPSIASQIGRAHP